MRVGWLFASCWLTAIACDGAEVIRHCKPTTQPKATVGNAVAIGHDFIAFGSRGMGPAKSGAVYIYDGPEFSRETKLQPSDLRQSNFGSSVAADEDILVVGAQRTEKGRGAAYIFRKQGQGFVEVAKLVPSERTPYDHFGWSCSIDGGVIVVGAYNADQTGAAFVFENDNGKWLQTAKLAPASLPQNADFGISCDVDANSIVVGGRQLDGTGVAYVFEKEPQGWSRGTRLDPGQLSVGDRYGHAVAIAGDTVVITAAWDDEKANDSGAAYIWQRDAPWRMTRKIKDFAPRKGGRFGYSVSFDGNTVLIGSPHYSVGNAASVGMGHVIRRRNGRWVRVTTIEHPRPTSRDSFCMNGCVEGNLIAIGAEAPFAEDSSGSGWIFKRE